MFRSLARHVPGAQTPADLNDLRDAARTLSSALQDPAPEAHQRIQPTDPLATANGRGTWRSEDVYVADGHAYGFQGDDHVWGGAGGDWLEGGSGDDFIHGDLGDDTLIGGTGADFMRGREGADTFIFIAGDVGYQPPEASYWEPDVIHDFNPASGDVIRLYGFSALPVVSEDSLWAPSLALVFPDGSMIVLDGITAATLAAYPNSIVLEPGPPPALEPEPPGAPVRTNVAVVIDAGETQTFTQHGGYVLGTDYIAPPSFTNRGVIDVSGPPSWYAFGVHAGGYAYTPGTLVLNAETGVIRVRDSAPSFAIGFEIYGHHGRAIEVENRGMLEVSSALEAFGYRSVTAAASFTNSGQVTATGGQEAIGAYISNYFLSTQIHMSAPWTASTHFSNSGLIEAVSGGTAVGFRTDMRAEIFNGGTIVATGGEIAIGAWIRYSEHIVNTGDILAHADAGISVGLYIQNLTAWAGAARVGSYYNSGRISADIAILADDGSSVPSKSVEHIDNLGVIEGLVLLGFGDDRLINAGLIDGEIDLGGGDDVFDGREGTVLGAIDGGQGRDSLLGSAGADVMLGGEGDDAIAGGGGNDVIDGGRGADALDGGAGFDVLSYLSATVGVIVDLGAGTANDAVADRIRNFESVIGSAFSDRLTGSSTADVLEGNAGDDILLGGKGEDVLLGDTGADTITTGEGDDVVFFTAGDGHDVITDFTAGAAADQLRIFGYSAYQELRQEGDHTRVVLSATDSILLHNVVATNLIAADLVFDPLPLTPAPSPTHRGTSFLYWDDLTVITATDQVLVVNPDGVGIAVEGFDSQVGRAVVIDGLVRVETDFAGEAMTGLASATGFPSFWNRNGGRTEVISNSGADVTGISGFYLVWNDGDLTISSDDGHAIGVYSPGDYLRNTGLIEVTGETAVGFYGAGSRFWNDGDLLINSRQAGTAVEFRATWTDNHFVNTGLIRVIDETSALDSIGLSWWGLSDPGYFNSGVIEADYAIRHVSGSSDEGANDVATIWNSGELRGRVDMAGGAARIFNDGLITGRTDLGIGNDLYDGRLGRQTGGVFGGDGVDALYGGAEGETLNGGADDDILSGGGGADILTGGSGRDIFYFQAGSGADEITDFLPGAGAEAIRVVGYSAYQSITQIGDDVRIVFSATDTLLLRKVQLSAIIPADIVFSAAPLAATPARPAPALPLPYPEIAPAPPPPEFTQVGGTGADHLLGGVGDNHIVGGDGGDLIEGAGGQDQLYGDAGDDHILGGSGHDQINGGDGDDILHGETGDDQIWTGAGADVVVLHLAEGADQVFDFDVSTDWIRVENVRNGGVSITNNGEELFVSVSGTTAGSAAVTTSRIAISDGYLTGASRRVELYGTDGNDSLRSSDVINELFVGRVFGLEGNDRLWANQLGGSTLLDGGDGDDTLYAGGMNGNTLIGGDGFDIVRYEGVDIRQARIYQDETSWIVSYSSNAYGWGKDRIYDIEQLRFADGVYDIGAIVCWTGSGPRPKLPQIGPGTSPDDPVDGKDGGPQVQPGLTDFPSDWTLGPPETPGLPGEPVELDNPAGRTDAEEPPVIPVVAPAPDLDFGADLRMWREHEQIRGFGDYACLV